jgi:hypothetical protein
MQQGLQGYWKQIYHQDRFQITASRSVGGNRARRVDADTTAPWILSPSSLSLSRSPYFYLGEEKEHWDLVKTEQGNT